MKSLESYIKEALKVRSTSKVNEYNYHPKTRGELKELVKKLIEERGNDADLNDINTSGVSDMHDVFYNSRFNGNISNWDVSNVKDMQWMFGNSEFNGDISNWNVSNVEDMAGMFYNSEFNGDISEWDVSNVEDMKDMFGLSPLEKNPPKWWHK